MPALNLSGRDRGSAYLVAVGILGVLFIMLVVFSQSRTARRWSTRLMSNEAKVEAVAEAAANLALRMITDQMNDEENGPEWYYRFRSPAKIDTGLSVDSSEDIPLQIPAHFTGTTWTVSTNDACDPELEPLKTLLAEVPGSMTVEITPKMASASIMSAMIPDYPVVGVNTKSTSVQGPTGKFLDSLGGTSDNLTLDTITGNYTMNLILPNNQNPVHFNLPIHIITIPIIDYSIDINLDASAEILGSRPSDHAKIKISIAIPLFGSVELLDKDKHIYNEYLKGFLEEDDEPEDPPAKLNSRELIDEYTGETDWKSLSWAGNSVGTYISGKFNEAKGKIEGIEEAFDTETWVEKTGYLQLKVSVHYQPQINGVTISRTLSAEREFKVSDLQPVAPEYVFFVANSDLTYEDSAGSAGNETIEFIDLTGDLATTSFHAIPRADAAADQTLKYSILKDFSNGNIDDLTHLPGMLRINGSNEMKAQLFLGKLEEVRTTHYNALISGPPSVGDLIDPRFNWLDGPQMPMQFPRLPKEEDTYHDKGLLNLFEFFMNTATFDVPTLFFGDYMVEYPLNLLLEANLKQEYSIVSFRVKPYLEAIEILKGITWEIEWTGPIPTGVKIDFDIDKVDLDKVDISEVEVALSHQTEPYGIRNYPGEATGFNPGDAENLPANLYSSLQYAKKAKYYYDSGEAFITDITARGGNLDGVNFINESLEIGPITLKGRGLIVARYDITVTGDIKCADEETVLGLIAREGKIQVDGATLIQASCFSNDAIENGFGNALVIDGNLVVNHFSREIFNCAKVFYNGPRCRTSLLSMHREVGKFEPKRYQVILGKQWARFEYEKL